MAAPQDWGTIAYNQATESENRIHADDVARKYGFRGGLVPGVTVYAYLVHPALVAWGLDWLSRGAATVVLRKPIYDGDDFRVRVAVEKAHAYRSEVSDSIGVICADGRVSLPDVVPPAPARRGDPLLTKGRERPEATRTALEQLGERGMGALALEWRAQGELDRYVRSPEREGVPVLVQSDGDGYANPAFSLGLANFVLAANVRLGPWIHVESEVQNHDAIPRGSRLVVESRVVELFEKSGHEFVDLDVAIFVEPERCVLTARHRAIYRLREPRA